MVLAWLLLGGCWHAKSVFIEQISNNSTSGTGTSARWPSQLSRPALTFVLNHERTGGIRADLVLTSSKPEGFLVGDEAHTEHVGSLAAARRAAGKAAFQTTSSASQWVEFYSRSMKLSVLSCSAFRSRCFSSIGKTVGAHLQTHRYPCYLFPISEIIERRSWRTSRQWRQRWRVAEAGGVTEAGSGKYADVLEPNRRSRERSI